MIKVLQVAGSLKLGGLETVVMNIVRYSDKDTFKIDIVVYGEEEGDYEAEAKRLGCRVIHLPFPHKAPLTFVSKLRKVLRQFGPYDIVHSHTLYNCGLVVKGAFKEGVTVRISHSHTNRVGEKVKWSRRQYNAYMRFLIRKYTNVQYACSENAGSYLFGVDFIGSGHVLSNGINPDKFIVTEDKRERLKLALGIKNYYVIGQIGTLHPVKNHKFSIEIMKEILKHRADVRMLFIGKGALFEEISHKIENEGLKGYIYMLGPRNDVPDLLGILDVYLMPSKYEGVSVALMEAQAAGLHCVVTNTACAPEVHVTNQITTLTLNDSPSVWAEAIVRSLGKGKYANSRKAIKNSGYDIRDIISRLNKDYSTYIKEFAK